MANSSIKQMADRLTIIYGGDPWYGSSIKAVLKSADPHLVFDSPGNNTHTIAEIVTHMIAWRTFAIKRLKGEGDYLPNQEETFNWERFSTDRNGVWDILINKLKDSQEQLLSLLHQQDDAILNRKVAGKPYTFQYLLTGILQHDLYHLGQIAYLNKLFQKKPAGPGLTTYEFEVFSFENLALLK